MVARKTFVDECQESLGYICFYVDAKRKVEAYDLTLAKSFLVIEFLKDFFVQKFFKCHKK